MKSKKLILPLALLLFLGGIVHLDRLFFKANKSFCIRSLFTYAPPNPAYDLPLPTAEELLELDTLLAQKFHYLGKGAKCYAFLSDDQNYVIKFHRYPSHLRIFPWLKHPFSYHFQERRRNIKAHNIKRHHYNFSNYKNTYLDLKDESGLLFVHLNRTDHLKRFVTIVDKTRAEYRLPLDQVACIVQRRADLIYPTLDALYQSHDLTSAAQVVSSVIDLIATCCQKGYTDNDPVLRKNYGLIGLKAIHIDIGDLTQKAGIEKREAYIPYVKELTLSLRRRLEREYPLLLAHYDEEIARL